MTRGEKLGLCFLIDAATIAHLSFGCACVLLIVGGAVFMLAGEG